MARLFTQVRVAVMSDLLTRLTTSESLTRKDLYPLCLEAADEIERLRALIAAWADAEDDAEIFWTGEFAEASNALRQAVGR